jgi:hypothetical protein
VSRKYPLQGINAALRNGAAARELAGVVTVALSSSLGRSRQQRVPAPDDPHGPSRFATPIMLVHGYGGNRSTWQQLETQLGIAGFANRYAVSYDAFTADIPAIARNLVEVSCDAMDRCGTRELHLVGHSLGGVVVRYAVQCLGLPADAVTAVTVAAPHRGTLIARLGSGPAAVAVRPGSSLLAELSGASPTGVRWVSYRGGLDFVVRSHSACLVEPAYGANNVLVPAEGHLSILSSPVFLSSIITELVAQEARWDTTHHRALAAAS